MGVGASPFPPMVKSFLKIRSKIVTSLAILTTEKYVTAGEMQKFCKCPHKINLHGVTEPAIGDNS